MRLFFGFLIIVILLIVSAFLFKNNLIALFMSPRQPVAVTQQGVPSPPVHSPEIIAKDLQVPWEIIFLPDKTMLVTDRPGDILHIDTTNHLVEKVAGVHEVGEGGLLGMALHPDFKKNNWLYLYLTTTSADGRLINQVERYTYINNHLSDRKVILSGILASSNHDGGRMAFGPDGDLYITTGDAEQQNLAQDTKSLNGKILRIKDDGSIPSDNPFHNAVWSYGHRNPQGIAWDTKGQMWETEHGPSGTETGYDEVNLIEKGKNYGWPVIKGDETHSGMVSPIIQSGSTDTWAPTELVVVGQNLYFGGLRGQTLYQAHISNDNKLVLTRHLQQMYGRLRAVVLGPDGDLYISTSNTDGRGSPMSGDDKIMRVSLNDLP